MPVAVDTSGRVYDDFSRLLFLHAHREASALVNEIPEESEQLEVRVGPLVRVTSAKFCMKVEGRSHNGRTTATALLPGNDNN
jgi:hypothetical protein